MCSLNFYFILIYFFSKILVNLSSSLPELASGVIPVSITLNSFFSNIFDFSTFSQIIEIVTVSFALIISIFK